MLHQYRFVRIALTLCALVLAWLPMTAQRAASATPPTVLGAPITPYAADGTLKPGWRIIYDYGANIPIDDCSEGFSSPFGYAPGTLYCKDFPSACWAEPKTTDQIVCIARLSEGGVGKELVRHQVVGIKSTSGRGADALYFRVEMTDGSLWDAIDELNFTGPELATYQCITCPLGSAWYILKDSAGNNFNMSAPTWTVTVGFSEARSRSISKTKTLQVKAVHYLGAVQEAGTGGRGVPSHTGVDM